MLLGVLCLVMLLLAGFVHAVLGMSAGVVALALLLLAAPPSDRFEIRYPKLTIVSGALFLVVGAAFVWYSYWNFEGLLPVSPVRVPPYELTGLGATLFAAACTILAGGAAATSNMKYRPARALVVIAMLMFWSPVVLAFLRYGITPAFISVNEGLVDTAVVLLFVLAGALFIFGVVLNSMRPREVAQVTAA